MTPEQSGGLIGLATRAKDRLLGIERPREPFEIVVPHGSHTEQHYLDRLFRSLYPSAPDLVKALWEDYKDRLDSLNPEVHSDSNFPARDPRGEIEISSSGPGTIARSRLLALINRDRVPESRARRRILVTGIDLLLASYLAKNAFRALVFNGVRYPKDGRIETIINGLANLSEGDRFQILTSGRTVDVTLLPMRDDEKFKPPRFVLIGPRETDLDKVLAQARKKGEKVHFYVKRNQLELGLSYLAVFNPTKIITTEESSSDCKVIENGTEQHMDHLPRTKRATLDFVVYATEGNVDEDVRLAQNGIKTAKGTAGVFGIDVTQYGSAARKHGLKVEREILPIPCYPVKLTVA